MRQLLNPIPDARQQLGGISQAKFYELVESGVVRLTKIGRRSFVHDEDLQSAAAKLRDGSGVEPGS